MLVAGRGEIAVRVIRACRDLGIGSVAVYSDADRAALHVRFADEAYRLGPAPATESYLRIDAVLDVARKSGADAVHPGYGFLAENPAFARACTDAGLVFVGPPPDAMALLGEKTAARRLAREVGVPIVLGPLYPVTDPEDVAVFAREIGFPVMIKAASGGGGKGMRLVSAENELETAIRGAQTEAKSAFGDPSLFVESVIRPARHIEAQFLADAHGSVVWLGERDCSIQRRHQKLIEETPAPSVDEYLRAQLVEHTVQIARRAGYVNVGTAEFLVDERGDAFFLEVNARLQVEHPVTELVTRFDLVTLQLAIAAGERLPFGQGDVRRLGHAIECRLSAEDPERGFVPSAGTVSFVREPDGPGIRVDSALYPGMVVPTEYDPLLAKVIAHGRDRAEALARMRRALRETAVAGLRTTLPFHQHVLEERDFVAGRYDTDYVESHWPPQPTHELDGAVAAATAAVIADRRRPSPPLGVDDAASAWRRGAREDALR